MPAPIDPVTSALTGHLTFHLLLAAVLTWPISIALLRLYTRAVRRSMRSQAHAVQPEASPPPDMMASAPQNSPVGTRAATLHDLPEASSSAAAEGLLARLIARPRRAAFVYAVAAMEQLMRKRDTRPDRDLRFRVNERFCYDDTWKMVLSRLVDESDAVLMDLRGFSRQNAGCVFELHELVRLVPLDQVVFIVDRRTDEALLAETLGDCRAGVLRLGEMRGHQVRQLLRAMAAAAHSAAATGV
jgi:hypothetical protein